MQFPEAEDDMTFSWAYVDLGYLDKKIKNRKSKKITTAPEICNSNMCLKWKYELRQISYCQDPSVSITYVDK